MFSLDELNVVMRMDTPRHRIIPFHISHLDRIELNDHDNKVLSQFPDYREYMIAFTEYGVAYTAVGDDIFYAMFGVFPLWRGVAEAWLMPSRHINRKTIAMHRASLRFFEHYAHKNSLVRLQFTVHSHNSRAVTWAERCYFNREGILKNYGPDGLDHFMYARYFNG